MSSSEWIWIIIFGLLAAGMVVYTIWKVIDHLKLDNKKLREDNALLEYLFKTDRAKIIKWGDGPTLDQVVNVFVPAEYQSAALRYLPKIDQNRFPDNKVGFRYYVIVDRKMLEEREVFQRALTKALEEEWTPAEFVRAGE